MAERDGSSKLGLEQDMKGWLGEGALARFMVLWNYVAQHAVQDLACVAVQGGPLQVDRLSSLCNFLQPSYFCT